MHEGPHLVVVLDPHGRLDRARNVDSIGLVLAHEFAHVTGFKTTGDKYLPSYQQLAPEIPIPGLTGAAALVEIPGIEHDRVGPRAGVGDLAVPDLQHFDDRAARIEIVLLGTWQLQHVQAHAVSDLPDLRG